jgi:hypothetical protein
MSVNPKQSTAAPQVLLKNAAAAPVIYFDAVPVFGSFAGHIEVEIAARILMPKPDGTSVVAEMLCVAHLRCSPQAAEALTDALDKALDMHTKQQRGLEN